MDENNKDTNIKSTGIDPVNKPELPRPSPETMSAPPQPPLIQLDENTIQVEMQQYPLQNQSNIPYMQQYALQNQNNITYMQQYPLQNQNHIPHIQQYALQNQNGMPYMQPHPPPIQGYTRHTLCSVQWWRTCCDCCCKKPCVITVTGITIFATVLSIVLAVLLSSTPSARGTQSSTETSTYSSALTTNSRTYIRYAGSGCKFYYEALQVTVSKSGNYSFTSNSSIDTFGYMYRDGFFPNSPTLNLVSQDDDNGEGNQFQLIVTLQSNVTYYLVVTTYATTVTGSYSIVLSGSWKGTLFPINMTSSIGAVDPSATISTISSVLIPNNTTFVHCQALGLNSYYQTFQVNVAVTGIYTFISNSSIDAFGYIYEDYFNPNSPATKLVAYSDGNILKTQTVWKLTLQSTMDYYLVIASYIFNVTGLYDVKSYGPTIINVTSLVNATPVYANYSNALTTSSPTFMRLGSRSTFYYNSVKLNVSRNGIYYFKSISNFDAYGYLYSSYFMPSWITLNQLTSDDNSGGNRQFLLSWFLRFKETYVLVFTTFSPNVVGSFSITAWGSGTIIFI